MKRNGSFRKTLTTLAALLPMVLLLSGCGASDGTSEYYSDMKTDSSSPSDFNEFNYAAEGGDYYAEAEENGSSSPQDALTANTDRKLIRKANLEVETREFEQAMWTLEEQVRELGGYMESMETYNGSLYSGGSTARYADLTVRIPKDQFTGFLDGVSRLCNVVRRSDSVDDVTLTYVDLESHRNALRTEQTRLLELLEKAESLEDILTIEERLTNVRYQLESMESRLRTIDNQVDYSTVYLRISEVRELTPVAEKTAWQRISQGFLGSVGDIGHSAAELGIWFLVNLPHLVIWAAVITAIVLIIRRDRRKRAEKKAAAFERAKEGGITGRQINDK